MKRGKVVKSEGRGMPDLRTMKNIEEGGYKCLESLDADGAKYEKMKGQIKNTSEESKNILKSKLNGRNIILAINSRAVPVVRYAAGILSWTKVQLRAEKGGGCCLEIGGGRGGLPCYVEVFSGDSS